MRHRLLAAPSAARPQVLLRCACWKTRAERLLLYKDMPGGPGPAPKRFECSPYSCAGSRRSRCVGVHTRSDASGGQVRRTTCGRRPCSAAAKPSAPADCAPAPQAARRGAASRRRRASASPASRSTTRSCWSGGQCWSCRSARSSAWSRRRAAVPPPLGFARRPHVARAGPWTSVQRLPPCWAPCHSLRDRDAGARRDRDAGARGRWCTSAKAPRRCCAWSARRPARRRARPRARSTLCRLCVRSCRSWTPLRARRCCGRRPGCWSWAGGAGCWRTCARCCWCGIGRAPALGWRCSACTRPRQHPAAA